MVNKAASCSRCLLSSRDLLRTEGSSPLFTATIQGVSQPGRHLPSEGRSAGSNPATLTFLSTLLCFDIVKNDKSKELLILNYEL